jgi:predicted ArsR family transcriptional regulator
MSRRQRTRGRISDTRQIDALASPARQEIIDTLEAAGPCSAAELGALLGRAPDSLYFHLKQLENVALVKRTERDIGRGRTEAVYAPASHDLRLTQAVFAPENTPSLIRLLRSMFRITTRDLEDALESGMARVRGKKCNFRAARLKAWLTPEQIVEVNEHIDAIMTVMRQGERPAGGQLHAVSIAMTPVAPSERAASDTEDN